LPVPRKRYHLRQENLFVKTLSRLYPHRSLVTKPVYLSSFLFEEYTWSGAHFPGMNEEGDDVKLIMAASPGVGSVPNNYPTLVNVQDTPTTMNRGGMRGDSPGVGAISPYHGRSFYATKSIPPGGEIFLEYVVIMLDAGGSCGQLSLVLY
jgi:hypothetical protein